MKHDVVSTTITGMSGLLWETMGGIKCFTLHYIKTF